MSGDQLGLLDGPDQPATASPTPAGPLRPSRLAPPSDLDPDQPWQSCGPAALAAVRGFSLAAVRPRLTHERGYMSPEDMRTAAIRCGFTVEEKRHAWPSFGLVMIVFDGPWMQPGLPAGAMMRMAHWVAVDRHGGLAGGDLYDVNYGKVIFFEAWLHTAADLARQLDRKATGGWSVRLGLEITDRSQIGRT